MSIFALASASGLLDPTTTLSAAAHGRSGPARFTAILHGSLDAAATAWRTLQDGGACTAYQRLDWVRGIVEGIMPVQKAVPLVVEVRDAQSGGTVMLLPLARWRRPGYNVLTWLDMGVCDYAAPLIAPGFTANAAEAAAIWTAVRRVLPRTDLIHFQRIPTTVGRVPNPLALLPGVRPMHMQAFGLPIDGPPETLLKRNCSPSANQKFRKAERRLAREGEVRFLAADTAESVEAMFAALLDQRRQRFRDLGRFDLLDRPDIRAFYHAMAQAGLSGGPARLFGLSVDGKWIATAFGLVHGGTFHGILLAMDTAWRQFSPGLRIITEIMVWARRHDIDYFDLTVGDLRYKADLGAQGRELHELALATSLRGTLILLGIRGAARAKAELQARHALFDVLRKGRQAIRRAMRRA